MGDWQIAKINSELFFGYIFSHPPYLVIDSIEPVFSPNYVFYLLLYHCLSLGFIMSHLGNFSLFVNELSPCHFFLLIFPLDPDARMIFLKDLSVKITSD